MLYDTAVESLLQFSSACKKRIIIRRRKEDHEWITPEILAAMKFKEFFWRRCKRLLDNVKSELKIAASLSAEILKENL